MRINESIVEDAALEWSCLLADTHRLSGELSVADLESKREAAR